MYLYLLTLVYTHKSTYLHARQHALTDTYPYILRHVHIYIPCTSALTLAHTLMLAQRRTLAHNTYAFICLLMNLCIFAVT
jgi:hypothetical protein